MVIKVGISALDVCKAPDQITTIGLGSCVGVVLYDEQKKIAGLVHIMLPKGKKIREHESPAKFADTGIEQLIAMLKKEGVAKSSLKAKIAGGAKMFEFTGNEKTGNIGEKNVAAVKEILSSHGIPLIAESVGENFGRTIVFNPETCLLTVSAVGRLSEEI